MRNGYRHVVTDDGTQGWVWSNNVEVQDQGDTNEETGGDTDLLAKLLAAHSDAVGQPLIENGATVCGPTGDTPDDKKKALNENQEPDRYTYTDRLCADQLEGTSRPSVKSILRPSWCTRSRRRISGSQSQGRE